MAPFEAVYERRCGSPIGLFEVGEFALFRPKAIYEDVDKFRVISETVDKFRIIRDRLRWPKVDKNLMSTIERGP